MYHIYSDTEFIKKSPSIHTAKREAITLFKKLGKDIFVWRHQARKSPELIMEVIEESEEK